MAGWVAAIAGSVAALAAAAGLGYAAWQLRRSRFTAQGQFLLDLDKRFDDFEEVHRALRPGGKWSEASIGPVTADEWADVDDYMGMFEVLNIFVKDKIVDKEHISSFYLYRLHNIWHNEVIIEGKLEGDGVEYWVGFIEVSQVLGIPRSNTYDLAAIRAAAPW